LASNLENIRARIAAITAELAALDATKPGGVPDSSGQGESLNHTGYKMSLYDELERLQAMIARMDILENGPWRVIG